VCFLSPSVSFSCLSSFPFFPDPSWISYILIWVIRYRDCEKNTTWDFDQFARSPTSWLRISSFLECRLSVCLYFCIWYVRANWDISDFMLKKMVKTNYIQEVNYKKITAHSCSGRNSSSLCLLCSTNFFKSKKNVESYNSENIKKMLLTNYRLNGWTDFIHIRLLGICSA
jgi:hypothetical protein